MACTDKQQNSKQERHAKQASIGQPSEVLLVADNEVLGSTLKDSLEAMLTANVPGLNQGEDFFRLSRIPLSMHEKEFQKMHSVLIVKVDKKLKDVTLGSARDVWASPQLQMQLEGPSVEAIGKFLSSHQDYIRNTLLEDQLMTQTTYLKKHHSAEVVQDLKQTLGYTVFAPKEIKFTKKGKDFLWGSSRSSEKQLNMVFYALPYHGENLDDDKFLAQLRDSVMKINIPGSTPGQWMETTWEGDQPIVMTTPREINGQRVVEMRGLWQMHNGAMGGPFVSLSAIDKERQEIIVAEGFVYSPSTTKRDLMRRLEAALRTLKK